MARYHISRKGEPAICRAITGRCPLGGDSVHFDSKEDAQEHIEKRFQQQYNTFSTNGYHESIESGDKKWTTSRRAEILNLQSFSSGIVIAKRRDFSLDIRQKLTDTVLNLGKFTYLDENSKIKDVKFEQLPTHKQLNEYDSVQTAIDRKNQEYDKLSQEISYMKNTTFSVPRESLKRQKKLKKQLTKLERMSIHMEKRAPKMQRAYYDKLSQTLSYHVEGRDFSNFTEQDKHIILNLRRRMSRLEFNSPGIGESSNRYLYGTSENKIGELANAMLENRSHLPSNYQEIHNSRTNNKPFGEGTLYKEFGMDSLNITVPQMEDEWSLAPKEPRGYDNYYNPLDRRTDEEIERADKEIDDLINKTKKENRRSLVFGRFKKKAKTVPPPPEPPAGFGMTQPNYSFPPLPQQNSGWGGGWGSGNPPTMQQNNNQGQPSVGHGTQSSYW